jgi:hypothetical protein
MKDFDSFDHRPDPALGRLLREHMVQGDDHEFVVRMQAAARQAGLGRRATRPWRTRTDWSVPDGWFRPGIAAAAAVLLCALVGAQVVEHRSAPASLAEALRPAEAPSELFAADAQLDPQLLLSPLLEVQ